LLQLDDSLDCNRPKGDVNGRQSARRKTFSSLEQDMESKDLIDVPIFLLLKMFGENIPPCRQDYPTPSELNNMTPGHHDHWIDISFVGFHAVHVVAGIRIQWVDCLSLHLEFDSLSKTLKVFRFPSICLIMYRNTNRPGKNRSILSQ
jgi:hypothetical protein